MKRVFFFLLFTIAMVTGNSQTRKIDSSRLGRPVINSGIKTKIIAPSAQQTNTAPVTNVSLIPVKQTATGMIYELPTESNDLKIELVSIEKDDSNFDIGLAGIYTIKYNIINSGLKDINITSLGIQSLVKIATNGFLSPQGGYSLTSALLAQTGSTAILHPGEKYQEKTVQPGYNPTDAANTFIIKIDHNNLIAESNENNNTLEIPVRQNLEWSQTPLPDLTFEVNSVVPVPGGGYLNARWDAYLVNTGAGEIPLEILRKILPRLQVYPNGNPGTNLYNEVFPLEQRVNGTQVYPGYNQSNLPLKPGGKINISGASHVNGLTSGATVVFHFFVDKMPGITLSETNTSNNTVDFLYKVL